MDINDNICRICGSPLREDFKMPEEYIWRYNCYRCGKFKIFKNGMMELNDLDYKNKFHDVNRVNISGWIREHQGSDIIIDAKRLKFLMTLPELSVFEKADKMLLYLAKKFPIAGMNIDYEFNEADSILDHIEKETFPEKTDQYSQKKHKNAEILLPLIAVSRIINGHEFSFVFMEYLRNEQKYISKNNRNITSKGWAYLETFRHPNPDSKKAFVAMWFDEKMREIHETYIKQAAYEAGEYDAQTIDEKDFNGDIYDAIIGEIRSSKFIIADFTGNRDGVYYEAGFADGFNIPVIYTCKEDWWDKEVEKNVEAELVNGKKESVKIIEKRKVHFDLNHKNFIRWKDGKDLQDKLVIRIKALPLT